MNTERNSVRWGNRLPILSVRWSGLAVALTLLAIPAARAVSVTAGTVLTTQALLTYSAAGQPGNVTSAPVSVTVDKAAVARLSLETSKAVVNGSQAFACTITNAGNYVGDFRVVVTQTANTSAMLVEDSNKDGVWQRSETTRVTGTGLQPDVPFGCFLVVKPRAGAQPGDTGGAAVFVAPTDNLRLEVSANLSITYGDTAIHPSFTFEGGDPLNSSPTVRNGVALVGSDGGVLYAVTAKGQYAGTLAWRYPASGGVGAAIRGRVAVDATGYYFTANNGWAYHLSDSGAEVWKTQVVPDNVKMEAMPLLDANAVTLACGDGRVRRLDKATGALLGTSQSIGAGSLTTPSAPRAGELWLGASDGSLYSVNDAHGFTVLSAYSVSTTGVLATPYVDIVSGLVLSVTPEGNVYAMRIRSSEMVWGPVALGAPINGAPWVDSKAGLVYFASTDGRLFVLHVKDGRPADGFPIQLTDTGGFQNTPIVAPAPDGTSVAFLASDSGRVIAASIMNPTLRTVFDTSDPSARFLGSPALSGIRADDVLVAGASNGTLYGFLVGDLAP